ncbi:MULTISPECIES: hypothetical protein [unclassified Nocardia]|uniref:hypothetical protein n=1 Tax=unclassified Nocardia TaxID=2637762 RepID=UPI001CE479A3|nr:MULTISPECIES: hypothetical protein [unclassified Nocardia]
MRHGIHCLIGAFAATAIAVAAPAASAVPTDSSGFLNLEVIIVGNPPEEVIVGGDTPARSHLDSCWATGFPRDIDFHNLGTRNVLVYASKDCTGAPSAVVPWGTSGTYYGWSAKAAG